MRIAEPFLLSVVLVGCAAPPRPPDLVLVSVDTLRADRLETYGAPRPTSPRILELSAGGLTFDRAVAQAPWTAPSMASVHTGLYPSEHGVDRADRVLAPERKTVAEVLRDAGYQCAAVITHAFVGAARGFDQGFEIFDDSQDLGAVVVTSQGVTDAALAAWGQLGRGPRFLWTHYFDPHAAFVTQPSVEGLGDHAPDTLTVEELQVLERKLAARDSSDTRMGLEPVLRAYDQEIAYTDRWIGRLMDGIRAANGARPVVFVLVADHGELFMERGRIGHGREVYQALVGVPLIVGGDIPAGLQGMRVDTPVETASIGATLLRLAGVAGAPLPGTDLLALAAGETAPPVVLTEGSYAGGDGLTKRAIFRGQWKLIHRVRRRTFELYDLDADPEELNDLAGDSKAAEVEGALRNWLAAHPPGAAREIVEHAIGDEERARLNSLGYLN